MRCIARFSVPSSRPHPVRGEALSGSLAAVIAFALLFPATALAAWPLPSDAPAEAHADGGSWPSDPLYAQSDWLWSHTSDGVGASVDRALSVTRGAAKIVIAVIGAGVDWESKDLVNQWALSRGELPAPQNANGSTASGPDPHDRNGDGRFNMQDYASATGTELPTPQNVIDPRLSSRADKGDVNGNGLLDPEDLLQIFGNGVDEDSNGAVDDVCGFDFAMNDANARAETQLSDTFEAELAVAQANDAFGYAGACPGCAVVPLRISLSQLGAPSELARALRLARTAVALVTAPPFALNDELRAAAAASPSLIIAAPSQRPGVRMEALDALPAVLRADPIDAARVIPSWAPSPLTTSVRVPPSSAPAAVLAGIAGLVASRADELNLTVDPARLRALLLATASSGRVNARAALDAVSDGRVPPALQLSAPTPLSHSAVETFDVNARLAAGGNTTLVLEAAPGAAPSTFTEFARVDGGTQFDGKLGSVDPRTLAFPPPLLGDDPFSSALTLRVRAERLTADGGLVSAEARETVFLTLDHQLRPPYPIAIPGAGAAAPKLVDVDGDFSDDLVVPGSDGRVHVLNEGGAPLDGFPVQLDGGGYFAPAAITDFDNNGIRDIAVTSVDGQVALFDGLGRMGRGFPVWLDCPPAADAGCAPTKAYSAPVMITSPQGNLVIQADAKGHVHVFLDDSTELPGSPVTVGSDSSPIVATPAVSDVDNDGWPDIIVGTAELSPSVAETTVKRLSLNPAGIAENPEFKVKLPVTAARGLDLQSRGIIASPIIVNLDRTGRREIILRSSGSGLRVFNADGLEVAELAGTRAQSVPSTPAVADLNHDGPFELIDNENGSVHAWTAGVQLLNTGGKPSLGAAEELTGFPLQAPSPALSGFAVADINGDREAELIFSSEEPVVHAISRTGDEADEWPKQLPGGSNAHVAVGVMGSRIVVAALTRDGRAYIWDCLGTPADIQWDSFQHDPANTGSTGTPLPKRKIAGIGSRETPPDQPESCCTGAPSPLNLIGLVGLLMSLRLARVRRRAI